MAGIKITDLPAAPSALLSDVFPVDQLPGPVTYKESNSQLLTLFEANIVIGPSNFSGILPVPNGGTGNSTFTAYSVICAGTTATGAFQNVAGLGTAGQQLTSNGAGSLPSWQAASSSGTVNSGTANEIAYYATTGTAVSGLTGAVRSVLVTNNTGVPSMLASASTTGQVLQGSTTGAPTWSTPTYPSASGTAGFILRSDGTNNVYSQSTFADLYAASGFLYANGANNIAGLATANNGLPVTGNTGIPVMLAGPGATGRVLTSNAAAAPTWSTSTFPSVGGAAGNILISDGTNYIASTSLWPNTVGAVGKILRSDGTTNAYTTATFADTYAVSTILYAGSTNAVSGLATTNRASLSTNSTGAPTWLALTDGQLVVGSTAGSPAAATITAGAGISVTNASNSITITATGGGFAWSSVAGTTQAAAVENGYILANAAQTTVTLPAVYAIGDTVTVVGSTANTGGWILAAAAGDTIRVNNSTTSAGGTVTTSAVAGQTIEVVCDVANTSWVMVDTSSVILTTA